LTDAVSGEQPRVSWVERSKIAMLDIGMIAIGIGFFVASIPLCARLRKNVRQPCCSTTCSARS
jgi:hypothetical protein